MNIRYQDVTLRAIEPDDLELLREMSNDPIIDALTGGFGLPVSSYQQKQWYESLSKTSDTVRLIIDTDAHGAVGVAIFTNLDWKNRTAEYHIKLASSKSLFCRGYGTKATKAMLQYAFLQMNLECIYGYILDTNAVSLHFVGKCGFVQEGVLRRRIYKNGCYHDQIAVSVLKEDFLRICPPE